MPIPSVAEYNCIGAPYYTRVCSGNPELFEDYNKIGVMTSSRGRSKLAQKLVMYVNLTKINNYFMNYSSENHYLFFLY